MKSGKISKPATKHRSGRKADYAGASPEQVAKAVLSYKPPTVTRSDSKKDKSGKS